MNINAWLCCDLDGKILFLNLLCPAQVCHDIEARREVSDNHGGTFKGLRGETTMVVLSKV